MAGQSRLAGTVAGALPALYRSAAGGIMGSGVAGWLAGRERRERFLILVGAAVLFLYLAYALVWQPLAAMRTRALADIAKYEAVTARVKAAGSNLQLAVRPNAPLPDATVITESATGVGLTIRRLEPEGERTRIELEDAEFTVLMNWLAQLESEHSLHVAAIEIARRPLPGMVSARISVVR